ncbi:MAG: DUF1587 domain-containing protein, partial [Pseudomonadota bacterium]
MRSRKSIFRALDARPRRSARLRATLLAAAFAGAGCSGVIGPGGGDQSSGSGTGGAPVSTSGAASSTGSASSSGSGSGVGTVGPTGSGGSGTPGDPNAAGLFPVQRLTAREYLNTVRDLLGSTTLTTDDVPGEADDTANNAFPFRQPTSIATVDATNLEGAAEQTAQSLAAKITSILPSGCTAPAASAEAGC